MAAIKIDLPDHAIQRMLLHPEGARMKTWVIRALNRGDAGRIADGLKFDEECANGARRKNHETGQWEIVYGAPTNIF